MNAEINAEEVARYLHNHPEFFRSEERRVGKECRL